MLAFFVLTKPKVIGALLICATVWLCHVAEDYVFAALVLPSFQSATGMGNLTKLMTEHPELSQAFGEAFGAALSNWRAIVIWPVARVATRLLISYIAACILVAITTSKERDASPEPQSPQLPQVPSRDEPMAPNAPNE